MQYHTLFDSKFSGGRTNVSRGMIDQPSENETISEPRVYPPKLYEYLRPLKTAKATYSGVCTMHIVL